MASPRSFSIHGRGLKLNTRADIEPHLETLRATKDVEEVHFGGNTLGVEASEALAEVLVTLESLKVADFADVFTGRLITEIPQALAAICNSLKGHASLIELDLSDNAFGGRSADPIVPFLTQNRTFQVLKLNNNGLGPSGGAIIANALLESAKLSKAEGKVSNLRTVICGRNRLQDDSAPMFAEAFAAHGGLVEVRMPQNGIRMGGIAALAAGLASNPNLESLDLQDNCAKGSGTRALAQALPSWPELRTLNLSECLLGGRAGIALASALSRGSNPKLETLKLELGELDNRSLSILAEAIRDHGAELTTLEINANRADPEEKCIQDIKAALEKHGHEDALGELDEMEEYEEEEESEEEEKDAEEEEEDVEENKEPAVKDDQQADDLADLMAKVSINPSSNGEVRTRDPSFFPIETMRNKDYVGCLDHVIASLLLLLAFVQPEVCFALLFATITQLPFPFIAVGMPPRYPASLAPDATPPGMTRAQKSRARREPSGAFQLFQAPQIQQFKEAFSLIDQDGDGIVSEKDLKAVFSNLGMTPTPNMMDSLLSARPGNHFKAPSMLDEGDTMPDRGVNFPMFLTMMGERLFEFDSEAELVEAFECFDENDTGTVKVDEVRKWLGEMGDRMGEEEIDRLLKGSFTDRQGNFKYREWVKVVRVNEEIEEGDVR